MEENKQTKHFYYCPFCGMIYWENKQRYHEPVKYCSNCKTYLPNGLCETLHDIDYYNEKAGLFTDDQVIAAFKRGDITGTGIMIREEASKNPLWKSPEMGNAKEECQADLDRYLAEHSDDSWRSMNSPTVKCPYCGSTNTKKISRSSKGLSTLLFGVFSSKNGKQWHCNHCKSDF